jgi:hypothetical protein
LFATDVSESVIKSILDIGKERQTIENNLLDVMLNGFSNINISDKDIAMLQAISIECNLYRYVDLIEEYEDWDCLSANAKLYLVCIISLNRLVSRGLAKRSFFCSYSYDKDSLQFDSEGSIENRTVLTPKWQAVALDSNTENNRKFFKDNHILNVPDDEFESKKPYHELLFKRLTYTLTSKGYDVALKLSEHADQKQRFDVQTDISKSSAESAKSSKTIAKFAVAVAAVLTTSSVLNLAIVYEKHTSQNKITTVAKVK